MLTVFQKHFFLRNQAFTLEKYEFDNEDLLPLEAFPNSLADRISTHGIKLLTFETNFPQL